MKDKRFANRGLQLEEFVRFANRMYAKRGFAVIEKLPTEFLPIRDRRGNVASVKVEHKSKVDFIGRLRNIPIAIEAKHTKDASIRFDRVEQHQALYMDAFTAEPGTIGLVLISFGLQRFFAVPWQFWRDAMIARGADRAACVTSEHFGVSWDIPHKMSVRADELDPVWEVCGTHRTFGLHYLENAERWIEQPKPENLCV
jgi:recombination protein U